MLTTAAIVAIIFVVGGVVSLTRGQTVVGVALILIGLVLIPGGTVLF